MWRLLQPKLFLIGAFVALMIGSGAVWAQGGNNGQVIEMAAVLNLRTEPTIGSAVIAEIAGNTPLTVTARTANNRWFQVTTPDGQSGWVSARYVTLFVPSTEIPLAGATASAAPTGGSSAPAVSTGGSAPVATTGGSSSARVRRGITLNLRAEPTVASGVITELISETPLTVLGRNADGSWLQVRTADGTSGWVAARYTETVAGPAPVLAGGVDGAAPSGDAPAAAPVATRGTPNFAKVGDEITVAPETYEPLAGWVPITWGVYSNLNPAVEYFRQGQNSFMRNSVAAGLGFTTRSVLDYALAPPGLCQEGETPLECELRLSEASIALIMLGTNDLAVMSADEYRANLTRIVQLTQAAGVTPAIGTIPPRDGFPAATFNQIINEVGAQFGAPVWDYGGPMHGLPNNGLDRNGNVWPSATIYLPDHVTYDEGYGFGYQLFNLVVAQTLDRLWREGYAG